MKKIKFMSVLALSAMTVSTAAVPVYAANNSANAGTEVTYTANSASPDQADWLVSYPKKVVLSDYNTDADKGAALKFELLDKQTSNAYSGDRKVSVAVPAYTAGGIVMTAAGTGGEVKMAIADSQKTDLSTPGYKVGDMSKKTGGTENVSTGYAYLKSKTDPDGAYSTTVNFTFTDDAS